MPQEKGLKAYRKYWETQAAFMDEEVWSADKIVKINLLSSFQNKLKELQLSKHCLSSEDGQIIVRIKVPYNYYKLDDFNTKVLELLGIENKWLIDISIDDSHCNSTHC